jgi:hypothetical protein
MAFLVKFDASGIHDFIFGEDVLKQVRGASALVDTLCRVVAKEQIAQSKGRVIYLGGGGGAARFERQSDAEAFMRGLQETYQQQAPGLGFQVAWAEEERGTGLSQQLEHLNVALSRSVSRVSLGEVLPGYLEPCTSCRQQPVVEVSRFGHHLCQPCTTKFYFLSKRNGREPLFLAAFRKAIRQIGSPAKQAQWQTVLDRSQLESTADEHEASWEQVFPRGLMDLGELAQRKGYFTMIYADGNRMGNAISAFLEKSRSQDEARSYRVFSEKLAEIMERATFKALFDVVPVAMMKLPGFEGKRRSPLREIEAEWQRQEAPEKAAGPRYILPFEILLLGGDDLVMMITPELALPFALSLQKHFREAIRTFNQSHRIEELDQLSLGIGMLTAPHRTPMRRMIRKTEALLDSAKRKSHQMTLAAGDFSGAIDWMMLTSESNSDLEALRTKQLELEDGCFRLTAKPYAYHRAEKFQKILEKVLDKKILPTGPLQAVTESCRQSRFKGNVNLLHLLGRLENVPRNAVITLLNDLDPKTSTIEPYSPEKLKKKIPLEADDAYVPFYRDQDQLNEVYTTPLLDFMEMLPFYQNHSGGKR